MYSMKAGDSQQVVHFLGQGLDEPEGALVLAEGGRGERAVVDPALGGGGMDGQRCRGGKGDGCQAMGQFQSHLVLPREAG